ncbi:uncharacterized protein LOC127708670 isoform X2 [Mytilus californianus]|uniref:uncharacterized protein LOC127708670 isoform X2 n=1 Tax=Mytilus californianus TaxID=6549 RepID=UPI002245D160|nr:uncharacterized protein LOC127708670 isoform X2 [Mytilus californianus]
MKMYTRLLVLLGCHMAASVCKQQCYYCPCRVQGNPCAEFWVESCNVFINSTVNMTCQLHSSYEEANSSHLYFERDGSKLKNDNLIVVDQSTTVLQHVVTTDDIRNNFYCKTKTNASIVLGKIELLYIDYYPQEIVNFSCVWEGMAAGSLQCFWKHPVEYRTQRDIDVSLEWKSNSKKPYRNDCSNILDKTKCENITGNIYGHSSFFRINVTNTRLDATTTTEIQGGYIGSLYGKPYKMENFTVLKRDKTAIELKWDTREHGMEFTIKYTTNRTRTVKTFNTSVLIQDLQTYSLYKFEVFAHYTDIFTHQRPIGLPSDSVYLLTRTAQDVAKLAPRVTGGAIEYAEDDRSKVRNITVYWQNFKEMEKNGPIVKFEVILESTGDEPISHQINSSNASQHTFTNIQSEKSGSVRIKAGTHIGMSAASSPIYIEKGDYKPPHFLLEKFNRDILISWQTENIEGVKGYTIYWCERTSGCEKQLQWAHKSVDETSYTVENLDFEKNYLFGLSMDSDNKSTGFSWENCYFIRNEIPPKPKSVTVQDRDQQSVTVVWARPGPCERSPFVEFYILYWCQADEKRTECLLSSNSSTRINSSITNVDMQYTIRNLRSGTGYVIWLKALWSAGKQSLEGEKNYNVTTMDPLQSEKGYNYLGVAIALPTLLVIVAVLLAVEIRCHMCRKIKEMSRPYEIDVPSIHIKDSTLRNLDKSGVYKHCTINRGLYGHDNKSLDISSEQINNPVQAISERVYNEEQTGNSFHSLIINSDEPILENKHAVADYLSLKDLAVGHNMDTAIQHQRSSPLLDDSTPDNSSSAFLSLFPVSYPTPLPKEKNETDCVADEYSEKLDERLEYSFDGSNSSLSNDLTLESDNTSKYMSHPLLTTRESEITSVTVISEEKSKDDNTDAAIQNETPPVIPSSSEYVSMKTIPNENAPDVLSSETGTNSHPFGFNCSLDTSLTSQVSSYTVLTNKHTKALTLQIYPGSFDLNKSLEESPESSSESISSVEGISFLGKHIDGKTTLKTFGSLDYSVLYNHPVTSPGISPVDTPPVLMNDNLSMSFNGYVFDINNPKQTIQNDLSNHYVEQMSEGKLQNRSQRMREIIFPAIDNQYGDTEVNPERSYDKNGNDITNISNNNNNGGYIPHSAIQKDYSGSYGNNLCVKNFQDEII